MFHWKKILLPLLSVSLYSCVGQADLEKNNVVKARLLYQSNQCRVADGISSRFGGYWIDDKSHLDPFIPAKAKKTFTQRSVDFNHEAVLALFIGNKPSSGYGLELIESNVDVSADIATLQIKINKPIEGMMQAQMTTSPCIYLAVERGNYHQIDVIDQQQKIVWSVRISFR